MVTNVLEPLRVHAGRSFLPVGARVHDGGVTFRVWAPRHRALRVATGDGTATRYVALAAEPGEAGFFSGRDEHGRAGDLYWIQIDERLLPDLASRFQPRGVDGPSQVVDSRAYVWRATGWKRPPLRGRTLYELHMGAFTPEGTFAAATRRLAELADLGVNTIELMPLGDFPGGRNWGYDGVMLHAPARCYGTPDALRALIDTAHGLGLAIVVDVVYNHLGPCGNVMAAFSDDYFHHEFGNPWGSGLNFDGANSAPVREFFLQNACMWLDEYRVDGLRLDAVHAIHDRSAMHLVAEVAAAAQARGAFTIAEDERNDARVITPRDAGGWGVDGVWSDDFHHAMRVGLTGRRDAHYANYTGTLDEWVETLREGWLYRGQFFPSWERARGTPTGSLPPEKFVLCVSNHDQAGNRPLGDRLSAALSLEAYRAMSMLLCLGPYTPLLFMGQEWAARTPFPFFSDLPGEVGAAMARHRREDFQRVAHRYPAADVARMPDPQAAETFRAAQLDWSERDRPENAGVLALYRECLHLRAAHATFAAADRAGWSVEKLSGERIALRWIAGWLLVVAPLGAAELTPGERGWALVLSSNEARFGGRSATGALQGPGAALWRRIAH